MGTKKMANAKPRQGKPIVVWLDGETLEVFEELRDRNGLKNAAILRALIMNAKGKTISIQKKYTAEVK